MNTSRVDKDCLFCSAKFSGKAHQKYCKLKCYKLDQIRKIAKAKEIITVRSCFACSVQFSTQGVPDYCSSECRKTAWAAKPKEDGLTKEDGPIKTIPKGRYVYGWYSPSGDLPFYIGQGTGRRAWRRHETDNGSAFCQMFKTQKTKVVVYRDNLTMEGALLVESVIKHLFESLGAPLTNQSDTMKHQEVPPLETRIA